MKRSENHSVKNVLKVAALAMRAPRAAIVNKENLLKKRMVKKFVQIVPLDFLRALPIRIRAVIVPLVIHPPLDNFLPV